MFEIDKSINTALCAAPVLALGDVMLRMRLTWQLADQTRLVIEDAESMEEIGFEE